VLVNYILLLQTGKNGGKNVPHKPKGNLIRARGEEGKGGGHDPYLSTKGRKGRDRRPHDRLRRFDQKTKLDGVHLRVTGKGGEGKSIRPAFSVKEGRGKRAEGPPRRYVRKKKKKKTSLGPLFSSQGKGNPRAGKPCVTRKEKRGKPDKGPIHCVLSRRKKGCVHCKPSTPKGLEKKKKRQPFYPFSEGKTNASKADERSHAAGRRRKEIPHPH